MSDQEQVAQEEQEKQLIEMEWTVKKLRVIYQFLEKQTEETKMELYTAIDDWQELFCALGKHHED